MICNSATLRCEQHTWAHWLRWAETNGCLIGVSTKQGEAKFGLYDPKPTRVMGQRRMQATMAGQNHPDDRAIKNSELLALLKDQRNGIGGGLGGTMMTSGETKDSEYSLALAARNKLSVGGGGGEETDSWGLDVGKPGDRAGLGGDDDDSVEDWEDLAD